MPRLRRVKEWEDDDYDDLDFSSTAWPSPDTNTATEVTESNNAVTEGSDYEQSGKSYWSNEAVIASMDDSKLRSALTRYRYFVRLCETEMSRRALLPRRPSRAPRRDNNAGHGQRKSRSKRTSSTITKPLSEAQLREALEVLREIQSKLRPNGA